MDIKEFAPHRAAGGRRTSTRRYGPIAPPRLGRERLRGLAPAPPLPLSPLCAQPAHRRPRRSDHRRDQPLAMSRISTEGAGNRAPRGSSSRVTPRWREPDSNPRSHPTALAGAHIQAIIRSDAPTLFSSRAHRRLRTTRIRSASLPDPATSFASSRYFRLVSPKETRIHKCDQEILSGGRREWQLRCCI